MTDLPMEPSAGASLARLGITSETLRTYDQRIPRYTSYPTAPVWTPEFDGAAWANHLARTSPQSRDLSLYVHIPFCEKRCLFCACNVIATRMDGIGDDYLDQLEREVALVRAQHRGKENVLQLHLGGGTPNFLTGPQMQRLVRMLEGHFAFDPTAERSIEVDPRIATREEIFRLYEVDRFNRISFGVQDFHDGTQEAIGREQGRDASFSNVQAARDAGFRSVNIDLIYGLPRQTVETWEDTLDCICEIKPDRIALYNFAWLPDRLPHQRQLDGSEMPAPDRKIEMFMAAHDRLTANGWRFLGMDHYARESDSLAQSFEAGTMRRNFMGYTTLRGTDMIGFGVTAIGDFGGAFAQNVKKLNHYREAIEAGRLPVERGKALTDDDLLRRECIESLMCQGRLDLTDPRLRALTEEARPRLEELAGDGLVTLSDDSLDVTLKGQFFLRNIAVLFDAYMSGFRDKPLFSRAV